MYLLSLSCDCSLQPGDGFQSLSDILTLNHEVLQLAAWWWWLVTGHLLPTSISSPPAYYEANKRLSKPSATTCEQLSCVLFPLIPKLSTFSAQSVLGSPINQTSTRNSLACHHLSLHCWSRSFHPEPSWQPPSHGTSSPIRKILLVSSDLLTISSLRAVWTPWGNINFFLRATLIPHDCATCRRLLGETTGRSIDTPERMFTKNT